jgi:sterol 3beta-glucosyltransferase
MFQGGIFVITILCAGSRGDFQPYIALAQELKKLGKEVRIVGGRSFEDLIKGYDIGFYPLSTDYRTANVDPKLLQAAQSSDNLFKMLITFNKMKKIVIGLTEETYYACEGSELIIYHPGVTIGYFAGEMLGIPTVLATPFPMHQTKEVASVIAYGKTRMPVKLSYTLLQSMLWMASKTGVAVLLKKKNGKLPKGFSSPFEKIDKSHPAIVSCSNFVFPRPTDWNENIHQYGYWFVEEKSEYTPSKELLDFLSKGEKPLYLGFGSVFNENQKDKIVRLIIDTLKKLGKRGMICGMGKIDNLPENIISIGSIPHTWLFERVSAVVHHGGAGTAAAGFRAGVPSIIVPFSNDQFAWAHRAFNLGVGSKPIYKKNLTAQRLYDAIKFALSDRIVANAKSLAQKIDSENGAMECAKIIVNRLDV